MHQSITYICKYKIISKSSSQIFLQMGYIFLNITFDGHLTKMTENVLIYINKYPIIHVN